MKVIDYKKEHFDDLLDGDLSNGTQKFSRQNGTQEN